MKTHTRLQSTYVRSAKHMSKWNSKVNDRFSTMMARLKGHKQKLREHQDLTNIDDDYLVEEKDQNYFLQRCEVVVKNLDLDGPNDVRYTPSQLRR